jgi:elongation factor Ts
MVNITASLVKDLRDKTGAGMMDCKKALNETGGDMEAASDWLRKTGLLKAAKKATRVAAEGLVGVAVGGDAGALVEVNSETDFVARNGEFKEFVKQAARIALEEGGDVEKLLARPMGGGCVKDALTDLIAKIGENMSVRRAVALAVSPGVVSSYVHNAASPELGKIGVLVALKSSADKAKLAALGKQLAMHVAAASPLALTPEHLSKEVVDRERAIQTDLVNQNSKGKPQNIIDKMLEGRMRKFFEDSVLLAQTFVIDGETQVGKVLENASKELGTPVEIAGFVRFQVGEGIDKMTDDFADEVGKLAGH